MTTQPIASRVALTATAFALLLAGCGDSAATDSGVADMARADGASDMSTTDAARDGAACADADGDGHAALACGGDDCDDTDPHRYPGNSEVCDAAGHDEDCNPATLGPDADHDGTASTSCCQTTTSGLTCGTDCNDLEANVHSGAPEACNGVDDNCDGVIDEGLITSPYYPDCDGDGYGDAAATARMACATPLVALPCTGTPGTGAAWVMSGTDCDDAQRMVHPGALAPCDCVAGAHAYDQDGDHHERTECGGDDCDDMNAAFHPGAPGTCGCPAGGPSMGAETCDGRDEDCNGTVDDAVAANAWCAAQPHVTSATCAAGACGVLSCAAPFLDCSSTAPGCETDPLDPGATCGACGRTCAWGCAGHCNDAAQVVAGSDHTCARRASGDVVCWGTGSGGQLGVGSPAPGSSLTPLAALPAAAGNRATQLAAYAGLTCSLDTPLRFPFCWGPTSWGGGGLSPQPLVAPSDCIAVTVGLNHVCAVSASAGVKCWGDNTFGQVTPTPIGGSYSPVAGVLTVGAPADVVELAAGWNHTCGRRATGQVVCWGDGVSGQLGGSGLAVTGSLAPVTGVTDAVEIAAAGNASCARRATGAVVCWGDNGQGGLGDGTTTMRPAPVAVVGVSDAVEIAMGFEAGCARRAGGTVVCWGTGTFGGLGDGLATHAGCGGSCALSPVTVSGLTDAVGLAGGDRHFCAIRATGDVVCWGLNNGGTLGDGLSTHTSCGGADCALAPVTVVAP